MIDEINPATAVMEVAALRRQAGSGPCAICWTISWQPCEREARDAVPDRNDWMQCLCCQQSKWIATQKAEIERLASFTISRRRQLVVRLLGDVADRLAQELALKSEDDVDCVCDTIRDWAVFPETFLR